MTKKDKNFIQVESFSVGLVLVHKFFHVDIFAMFAIFFLDSGLGAKFDISFDSVLSVFDHLDHVFLFSIPLDFFNFPLIYLSPEVLYFLDM